MWTQFYMHDLLLQIIGVAGFLCYIIGFAGVQLGRIDGNSISYTLWALSGAVLVLISLIGAFNLASMLIQISWIVICLCNLSRRAMRKRATRIQAQNRPQPGLVATR